MKLVIVLAGVISQVLFCCAADDDKDSLKIRNDGAVRGTNRIPAVIAERRINGYTEHQSGSADDSCGGIGNECCAPSDSNTGKSGKHESLGLCYPGLGCDFFSEPESDGRSLSEYGYGVCTAHCGGPNQPCCFSLCKQDDCTCECAAGLIYDVSSKTCVPCGGLGDPCCCDSSAYDAYVDLPAHMRKLDQTDLDAIVQLEDKCVDGCPTSSELSCSSSGICIENTSPRICPGESCYDETNDACVACFCGGRGDFLPFDGQGSFEFINGAFIEGLFLGQYIDYSTCDGRSCSDVECIDCSVEDSCNPGEDLLGYDSCSGREFFNDLGLNCECFPFDSQITMCDGTTTKDMIDLVIGDRVLCFRHGDSYHDGTGQPGCCDIVEFLHLERKSNPYVNVFTNNGNDPLRLSPGHRLFKVRDDVDVYNADGGFSYTDTTDIRAQDLQVGDYILKYVGGTTKTLAVEVTHLVTIQHYGVMVAAPYEGEAIVVDGMVVNPFAGGPGDGEGLGQATEDYAHDIGRFLRSFFWSSWTGQSDTRYGIAAVDHPDVIPSQAYYAAFLPQLRGAYQTPITGTATAEQRNDRLCELAHNFLYPLDPVNKAADINTIVGWITAVAAYSPPAAP